MKIFDLYGTNYEMGIELGKYYESFLNEVVGPFEDALKIEKVQYYITNLKNILMKEHPSIYEEIKGRADGAKINVDAHLLMMYPEVFQLRDGCTTVMIKDEKGNGYFSHNEDDDDFTKENTCFIRYHYNDHVEAGYTCAKKVIGSCYGFNSYGLVISSNYLYPTKIELDKASRNILAKEIYSCKSVNEALDTIKNLKVASAFSINLFDINTNEMVNVEKDVDTYFITPVNDRYARSNHFLNLENGPKYSASSKFRYEKSKEIIDSLDNRNLSQEIVRTSLTYETKNYFESVHKAAYQEGATDSMTVSNMSIDSIHKKMNIIDYLDDNKEYEFEL